MPREGGASSNPRLLGSSTAVSGILDRPRSRAMTGRVWAKHAPFPAATSTDRRATIDHDGLSRREATRLRGQEHRGARDLVGLADAQKRCAGGGGLQRFRIFPERTGEIGLDQARRDAVHTDVVLAIFAGEVARE